LQLSGKPKFQEGALPKEFNFGLLKKSTLVGKYILNDYQKIFGDKLETQGEFEECYAFSLHKAGSTLLHNMINDVCRISKIPGFSIPDILFKEGVFEKEWEGDERILGLIKPGRVYFGFRQLPNILLAPSLNLKEKKSVLLVRDPRDALVSQYFSYGGKNISHKLPEKNKEAFLENARTTANLDIDEYVIAAAPNYLEKLNAYKNTLNFENVLLFKYEEIYFDKRKFLSEIFKYFGLSVEENIIDIVAKRNDIRPEVEDASKHIRKGSPGDHVNKLRAESIKKLDEIFAETCAWYGYKM